MHVFKPILMNYTDKLPFSGRQKFHRTITYLKRYIFSILCCHQIYLKLNTSKYISINKLIYYFRCGCDECITSNTQDSLRHSHSRINAYKALTSPSLIALSSRDPLLTAFELSWELRRLSTMESEFRNEYNVSQLKIEIKRYNNITR